MKGRFTVTVFFRFTRVEEYRVYDRRTGEYVGTYADRHEADHEADRLNYVTTR